MVHLIGTSAIRRCCLTSHLEPLSSKLLFLVELETALNNPPLVYLENNRADLKQYLSKTSPRRKENCVLLQINCKQIIFSYQTAIFSNQTASGYFLQASYSRKLPVVRERKKHCTTSSPIKTHLWHHTPIGYKYCTNTQSSDNSMKIQQITNIEFYFVQEHLH